MGLSCKQYELMTPISKLVDGRFICNLAIIKHRLGLDVLTGHFPLE